MSQLLGGIAKVTSLVLQCDTYQRLYMAPGLTTRPPKEILDTLEKSIIQAYAISLLFLGFVIQRQRSLGRVLDASFKLGAVEGHVKSLSESGEQLTRIADNCEKHCNYSNRAAVDALRQLATDQAYVANIYLIGALLTLSTVELFMTSTKESF
jgi:hypothetical protein